MPASSSSTVERVQKNLSNIDNLTSVEETRAKLIALPAQMCYEARYALQQVKDSTQDPEQLIEVVEPLARAIGWAEALIFAFDTTKEREVVKTIASHGATFNT